MAAIPVYKAIINDENEGIFKVSLVDFPAVESNFVAFKKDSEPLKFKIEDEDQHLLTGVVMRCGFPIYRRTDEGFEYYIVYEAETIKTMAQKLLEDNAQNNINLMHEDNTDVDSVKMIQLFIKDTDKGVNPAGFEEIEEGSLFATYRVESDDLWQQIKDGEFKGFSLEGYFSLMPTDEMIKNNKQNKKQSKMAKLKGILKSLLQEFGSTDTNKGTLEYEGTLEVGTEVTINDEPAADGEYETENQVIVVADGKVTEIRDKEVEEPAQEPAAEVEAKSLFRRMAEKFSESYEEKEQKIIDAVKALGIEYPWLYEAGDDYAIVVVYDADWNEVYWRYAVSWDEEGNAVIGDAEQVVREFVPAEEKPAATEEVEMAEDEPATEEPKTEEPKTDEPEERDLAAEIDALKAELDELKTTVNELKNQPANTPISESFQAIVENKATGNAKFDKALKRFSYMRK